MSSLSPWLAARVDAVLVIVDVQERLAAAMPERDGVVARIVTLAKAAKVLGMPILVTRQNPAGLGDTLPEVAAAVGEHTPIDKMAFCCREDAGFSDELALTWRGQVVLVGMEAHICITQTALALVEDGYRVHVVADATCSRRDSDAQVAYERLRQAGVAVTTTEAFLYEAVGVAGTTEFRAVLDLVKALDVVS
ncbi:MAG: hydrolase [Actinobacteria bacterium HGW-Actinobacteria-1]|jgi:nicotinamidase-related amidase|nr:MAG: hydrolase [Actinobacteria bacterium HGW-Actinobacteria-1]